MAGRRILVFAFVGLVTLAWRLSALAQVRDSKLPAAEIVTAISESEDAAAEADETQEPLPVTGSPIDWDYYAMPDTTRSWLFFNMPPEAFERLEENQDEHGKALFP